MFLENLNNLSLNCFSVLLKPVCFPKETGKFRIPLGFNSQFNVGISAYISVKCSSWQITIVQVNLVAKPSALTLSR